MLAALLTSGVMQEAGHPEVAHQRPNSDEGQKAGQRGRRMNFMSSPCPGKDGTIKFHAENVSPKSSLYGFSGLMTEITSASGFRYFWAAALMSLSVTASYLASSASMLA
jgi:hypothetical protein